MSYIYVMQNDGLPGLVQIGMTDDNPEVRAQELSNITGALGCFTVARQWQLKDAAIYERRISAVLGCYHVSGEHFRLPVEGAIRRITALLYSWGVVNEDGLTREEAEAVRKAARLHAEQVRIKGQARRGGASAHDRSRGGAGSSQSGAAFIHRQSSECDHVVHDMGTHRDRRLC